MYPQYLMHSFTGSLFLAPAGMTPSSPPAVAWGSTAPRTRGEALPVGACRSGEAVSASRVRGDGPSDNWRSRIDVACSRTRGDGPDWIRQDRQIQACSPHPRGWSLVDDVIDRPLMEHPPAAWPRWAAGRLRRAVRQAAHLGYRAETDPPPGRRPRGLGRRRRARLGGPGTVAPRRPASGQCPHRRRRLLRRDRLGDLCAGDPACDLAAPWILLPDGAADRFHGAIQPAADAGPCAAPAAGRCCALAGMLIGDAGVHGRPGGKPTWGPPAHTALRRLIATAHS